MAKEYKISVKKITGINELREACECTFNGTSKVSLLDMYKSEHSPIRTQLFWIKFTDIKLFVATHLIRHHVGSVPYQLTCRDDRKGGNPNVPERCKKIIELLNSLTGKESEEANKIINRIAEQLEDMAENTDRNTKVNLGLLVNAQSLIDMAKVRLCRQAHIETIEAFKSLKEAIREADPDLAAMMVPKCIYRNGLCSEPARCGYNTTAVFRAELEKYKENFTPLQQGKTQVL